jgi:hypothetical protein
VEAGVPPPLLALDRLEKAHDDANDTRDFTSQELERRNDGRADQTAGNRVLDRRQAFLIANELHEMLHLIFLFMCVACGTSAAGSIGPSKSIATVATFIRTSPGDPLGGFCVSSVALCARM